MITVEIETTLSHGAPVEVNIIIITGLGIVERKK
jgi:hypothetical protein